MKRRVEKKFEQFLQLGIVDKSFGVERGEIRECVYVNKPFEEKDYCNQFQLENANRLSNIHKTFDKYNGSRLM